MDGVSLTSDHLYHVSDGVRSALAHLRFLCVRAVACGTTSQRARCATYAQPSTSSENCENWNREAECKNGRQKANRATGNETDGSTRHANCNSTSRCGRRG